MFGLLGFIRCVFLEAVFGSLGVSKNTFGWSQTYRGELAKVAKTCDANVWFFEDLKAPLARCWATKKTQRMTLCAAPILVPANAQGCASTGHLGV